MSTRTLPALANSPGPDARRWSLASQARPPSLSPRAARVKPRHGAWSGTTPASGLPARVVSGASGTASCRHTWTCAASTGCGGSLLLSRQITPDDLTRARVERLLQEAARSVMGLLDSRYPARTIAADACDHFRKTTCNAGVALNLPYHSRQAPELLQMMAPASSVTVPALLCVLRHRRSPYCWLHCCRSSASPFRR